MFVNTKAIVLQRFNYSESDLIVRFYTEKNGLVSFILKGFRKSSNKKMSILQPLSIVDIVFKPNPKTELQYLKEMSSSNLLRTVHFDIYKTSIAFFIAEFTSKAVTQQESDPPLFNYIYNSILALDESEHSFANFHLIYTIGLASNLGFQIEYSFLKNYPEAQSLNEDLLLKINKLIESDYVNMSEIHLKNTERNQILDLLISYFYHHNEGMLPLNTNQILTEIFKD